VAPGHHLSAGLQKAAAKLCAVLGECWAACGDREAARRWWAKAASGLRGALDAEHSAVPVPRDSHTGELMGLSRLYKRLGERENVRWCLERALSGMKAVHWSCNLASQRAMLEDVQRGVRAELAQLG